MERGAAMYYGIVNATATLYKRSGKIHIVTKGHETVDEAQSEMTAKIKALPRRTYFCMYPFDTAVINIPDVSAEERETLFTIRDGYFGNIVLIDKEQTFCKREMIGK